LSGDVLRRLEATAPSLELTRGARRAAGGGGTAVVAARKARRTRTLQLAAGRVAPALASAIAVAILVPPLLVHVGVRVSEVRLGYELSGAAARLGELRSENERLKLERETLRAPDRLAPRAAEMGLVEPRGDRLWRVGTDGSVRVADVVVKPAPVARARVKPAAAAAAATAAPAAAETVAEAETAAAAGAAAAAAPAAPPAPPAGPPHSVAATAEPAARSAGDD
jgi:hypothetical protein